MGLRRLSRVLQITSLNIVTLEVRGGFMALEEQVDSL